MHHCPAPYRFHVFPCRRRSANDRNGGIPGVPPGDLYVTIAITLPAADSDAAKDLYRKMVQELGYDPRSKLGGLDIMNQKTLTGIVLDEQSEMSLTELCQACSSSTEWIVELDEERVLEPIGKGQAQWRFSGTNLVRARVAVRLQQDLEINLAGVALALELMEEIETMRERLRRFEIDIGS